jgi:hypothetical protein
MEWHRDHVDSAGTKTCGRVTLIREQKQYPDVLELERAHELKRLIVRAAEHGVVDDYEKVHPRPTAVHRVPNLDAVFE